MSGGGGGGGGSDDGWRKPAQPVPGAGGGGGDVGGSDPCNIVEVTTLNSVDRSVIAGLAQGQALRLSYDPGPPQRLLAVTVAGATAGSITSTSMIQLIACIQQGREYEVMILSVRGAQVQVRIQPI